MKKNLMSLAVAASVAGVATTAQAAMYLDPEGKGQVLLYPYYNAVDTNETSIHIVNTTADAKAVKVRILEYINSQEVLDFNLYMSPYDHFSFTIFQHPDGDNGALVTRDESCTVPRLGTATGLGGTLEGFTTDDGARIQPFLPFQYQKDYDGLDFAARSQVGHVEVIEMGTLTNENANLATAFNPALWATHDSDGIPANCDALVAAWDPDTGKWAGKGTGTVGANVEISAASGGLYGLSNVLDSADAAGFGIEPAAIEGFWASPYYNHTDPGTTSPSLGDGDKFSIVNAGGDAYLLEFTNGWDAVSSLFMSQNIYNDVMINPAVNGMTDWIVTFPTKREYVNRVTALRPFTDKYVTGTAASPKTYAAANLACEPISLKQWNREESTPVGGNPIFSPAPPTPTSAQATLCLETNTLAMGEAGTPSVTNTVLAEKGKEYLPASNVSFIAGEVEGWQRMTFGATGHVLPTVDSTLGTTVRTGAALAGLPVMGFAAFKYANGDRSYGFVSDHKTDTVGSAVRRQ